jgi:hypothetical protein
MIDDARPGTPIRPEGADSVRDLPIRDTELADRSLLDHMIRRPTEADFDDVLTPEGDMSGDIVGSDVSDATGASNDSLTGTG